MMPPAVSFLRGSPASTSGSQPAVKGGAANDKITGGFQQSNLQLKSN
jgi:hypothetical protein